MGKFSCLICKRNKYNGTLYTLLIIHNKGLGDDNLNSCLHVRQIIDFIFLQHALGLISDLYPLMLTMETVVQLKKTKTAFNFLRSI